MIEENFINWIDLGEAKQPLDIYGEIYKMKFFKLMMTIKSQNKSFGSLDLLFQLIFFLQVLTLSLYGFSEEENDLFIITFKYLSKPILLYEIADSFLTYIIMLIIIYIITLLFISILIYIIICIKKEVKPKIFVLKFLNILVIFEIYFLIGPIINLCLSALICKNGNHIYLESKCFSSVSHLIVFSASTITLLFHIIFSIILSIYYSDVGNIGEFGTMTRVSCYFEIYSNLTIILLFVCHFLLKFYLDSKRLYLVLWELTIVVFCSIFFIYIFKFVFFYNNLKNYIIYLGSSLLVWYNLVILLKQVLESFSNNWDNYYCIYYFFLF